MLLNKYLKTKFATFHRPKTETEFFPVMKKGCNLDETPCLKCLLGLNHPRNLKLPQDFSHYFKNHVITA